MKTAFSEMIMYFFAAAFTQNLILTTGLGSSLLFRIMQKPFGIRRFSFFLFLFTLLTSCTFYPIDMLLDNNLIVIKMLRPVLIVVITSIWYFIISLILIKSKQYQFHHFRAVLTFSAFNNIVIGIPLICNHQFPCGFLGTIGLSLGACLGFVIIMWITREALHRMNHPDMPKALQGFPIVLIFIGILALALYGFATPISFV